MQIQNSCTMDNCRKLFVYLQTKCTGDPATQQQKCSTSKKSAQEPTAPPIETHLRALFVRARLARSLFFYYSLYNGRGIFHSEDVCQVRMVAPRFIFHPHLQLLEPAATKM